jgi:predicted nucleic acid-binding protein
MATHCLDACSVIAYLRNEIGADVLKEIIEQPTSLLALPFDLRRDSDDEFIQRVGVIKVEERVSFADAFALALAERLALPLITTDHHEFDAVEKKGHFRFVWLR